MSYPINEIVAKMGEIPFAGDIIPHNWLLEIKRLNGKPDPIAVFLLAHICYWYRTTILREETTGKVIVSKKFKADLLQKSYHDLEENLGFTHKQLKDAFLTLERLNLAHREFRTIIFKDVKCSNVLFIKINPEKIKEITLII